MTTEPPILVEQAAGEGWVSVSQAARALGLSSDRVRQLIDSGRLKGSRSVLGRLVDPESLAALVEARLPK